MENESIPSYAELKAGVRASDLLEAINTSGYLFQAQVADCIRSQFPKERGARIQEEWTYIDSDSDIVRALDIHAEVSLSPIAKTESSKQKRIRLILNILVECKQSELPYVMFLRSNAVSDAHTFPEFGGVAKSTLRLFRREWSGGAQGQSFTMSLHDIFAC